VTDGKSYSGSVTLTRLS